MAMTQDEIMGHLNGNTPLNEVRSVFSGRCGAIEQAGAQRRPVSPVELRGMELDAVKKILDKAVEVGLVRYVDASDQWEGCYRDEAAENKRLRAALERIAESQDRGRHDGLPEEGPALDEFQAWLLARDALGPLDERGDR